MRIIANILTRVEVLVVFVRQLKLGMHGNQTLFFGQQWNCCLNLGLKRVEIVDIFVKILTMYVHIN